MREVNTTLAPTGTEILFIKVPPGNDKVPVDTTPEVEAWFREPFKEYDR
jgi:hypothetical protein